MSIAEKIPAWIRETTLGKKMMAETSAETLAKRKGHVAAIAELRKKQTAEAAPLLKTARKLEKTCRDAAHKLSLACNVKTDTQLMRIEAELLFKRADFLEAKRAASHVTHAADAAVAQHERALYASAPPELNEFAKELDELYQRARHEKVDVQEHRTKNLITDKCELNSIFTNARSKGPRLTAIQAMQQRVQEMKLEATEDIAAE